MVKALVFINAEKGYENTLGNDLKKLPSVINVYTIYGIYDLIVEVEADSIASLTEMISKKIRKINGIKSTQTAIVAEY